MLHSHPASHPMTTESDSTHCSRMPVAVVWWLCSVPQLSLWVFLILLPLSEVILFQSGFLQGKRRHNFPADYALRHANCSCHRVDMTPISLIGRRRTSGEKPPIVLIPLVEFGLCALPPMLLGYLDDLPHGDARLVFSSDQV